MRKILNTIHSAPSKRRLWDYHIVLCEYENGVQRECLMYPEEYEAEMIKQSIIEKHPDLKDNIEKMIELFIEHTQNENYRSNGLCDSGI
jgi:hypothetical protein